MEALRGIAVAPVLLERALQQRATDPAFAAWFDGLITTLMTDVAATVSAKTVEPRAEGAPVPMGLPSSAGIAPFEESLQRKAVGA
jgi:hypothetical protein